jgi:adenylate cyclase
MLDFLHACATLLSTGESVSASQVERRLAAIFAADVEGYARLMGLDEVATLRTLSAHRAVMDGLIAQHRGRIVNTAGDSVLAEFPSVVDAVECAVEVQQAIAAANAAEPEDRRMRFRIGINLGDILVKDGDLFGDGVNVAARLQAIANPGGICVSGTVRDHVGHKLAASFADLGAQAVKNIAEPVRVYQVELGRTDAGSGQRPSLPLPDKPSIAVLPFQNMSGDPEQEYFADGVVEEITAALACVRTLFVIARNSSFTYKGRAVDVKQVGRELGVRYVLEGSVRKSGNRVRITGQLIDAASGNHIWADRIDGVLEDIFDLQDRITESVVGAIVPRLRQVEIDRARRKPTHDLDAYDCYLRGISRLQLRNREGVSDALALFRRATEMDFEYAAAYGMTALCLQLRRAAGWAADESGEASEVLRLVRRVTETGRDDPVALSTAGWALAFVNQDVETGAAPRSISRTASSRTSSPHYRA